MGYNFQLYLLNVSAVSLWVEPDNINVSKQLESTPIRSNN